MHPNSALKESRTEMLALPGYIRNHMGKPLLLAWPANGNAGALLSFSTGEEWHRFIAAFGIDPRIPAIVQYKFDRAQRLYLMGWLDFSLIKAGELAALVALELAVMDRYAHQLPNKERSLANLLKHMVEADRLTDADIPMVVRCGSTAIGQLTGATQPTLSRRRNTLAHGDPFEGLPTGGLLELVRDPIDYAYRGFIVEAAAQGRHA